MSPVGASSTGTHPAVSPVTLPWNRMREIDELYVIDVAHSGSQTCEWGESPGSEVDDYDYSINR